jgi:hypothetical protein
MTIQHSHPNPSFPRAPVAPTVPVVANAYRKYPARDFGVGYGTSSGYASSKRYAKDWGNARFQCG